MRVGQRRNGRAALTSQIFLPEQIEANARDFLWRSLSSAERQRVAGTDPGDRPEDRAVAALAGRFRSPGPTAAGRLLLCDLVVS